MRVGDVNGTDRKQTAESLLEPLGGGVGRRKVDHGSFLHTDVQHEHSPRVVLTHQHVYISGVIAICAGFCLERVTMHCVVVRCGRHTGPRLAQ